MRSRRVPLIVIATVLLVATSGLVFAQVERRFELLDVRFLEAFEADEAFETDDAPSLSGTMHEVFGSDPRGDDGAFSIELVEEPPAVDAALQRAIRTLVHEDSWAHVRNHVEVETGLLRVVQTPDVIAEIRALLAALRRSAMRTVGIEVAIVPFAALDEAVPQWSAPGASPWIENEAMDRAIERAGDAARVFAGAGLDGRLLRLEAGRSRAFSLDFELDQTGVVPVASPWIGSVPGSARFRVRAYRSPSGDWFRVDLVAEDADARDPVERRRFERYGEQDLVRVVRSRAAATVAVPADRAAIVSAMKLERQDGDALPADLAVLLRVRESRIEDADAEEALRVLEVGILLDELPRFEIRRRERDEEIPVGVAFVDAPLEEELAPRTVRPDDILKLVPKGGSGAPAGELLGGRLLFRGTARDEAHIRAELERLARRRFEVIQTDLTLATLSSAERNALDTESGTVPAEALPPAEGEGVTFVRFLGVPGSPAILAAVDARSFVGGVDFVSGGTGFALVNLGDPETRCLGGGLVASVRVDPIPTTETFQVELFGDLARPPRFERRTRVRENQEIEPPREGQVGVIPRGSPIEIDLPDEDSDRLDHVATLPGGEARVLKTFVDALKPGNARVLIGSTRSVEIPAEEVEAEEP